MKVSKTEGTADVFRPCIRDRSIELKFQDLVKLIKSSRHVHSHWYLSRYPEVGALGMNPAEHYLKYGAAMGRDPGRNFNTRFYLETYPEAAQSGMNPLVHYVLHGQAKGYLTQPEQQDIARRIGGTRDKLLSLGFTETPLAELEAFTRDPSIDGPSRALAARELALWHLRQKTPEGWRAALDWAARARAQKPKLRFRSQLAVVELLCHYHLNQLEEGEQTYTRAALAGEVTTDLMLAWVNFQSTPQTRLAWINQVLGRYALAPLTFSDDGPLPAYDRLRGPADLPASADGPKVTVLMAAYEAGSMLVTALESLQAQTWRNLEILVIDDCSPTAETREIAARFAQADPRIRLIEMPENGGAYVARNRGLDEATGDFVTLNDADDWAHPRKIETQARYLVENPEIMGCTSEQARTSPDLIFSTLRRRGNFIIPNISSFMFRREPVKRDVGYWDRVRFGADVQFIHRIERQFGADNVVNLPSGPLAFQRSTPDSATGDSFFGYDGFKYGARKIYEDAEQDWLSRTNTFFIAASPEKRAFFAPDPMRPKRWRKADGPRHFDVIIASDFRFPGGTSSSNSEEIKAQKMAGLRTGLIELSHYGFGVNRPMNLKIRAQVNEGDAELICYGEAVECDTLIIRQPMCFNWPQRYVPDIKAKNVRVIINQPPRRDYSETGETLYDLKNCAAAVREMFGADGIWHPIGPLVRDALVQHHADDLRHITLAETDWTNIIDIAEWKRAQRPAPGDRPIRICRHSRDQYVKWPSDRETLLAAYPADPAFEINVLGGARTVREVLGGDLPGNWKVQDFGAVHPRQFLADMDVFVYYTHPDWVESFGRVIFEPMCVGVPCILPPMYRKLFGKAAIYAEPHEVAGIARKLCADPVAYERQVQTAFDYVEKNFSHATHIARLKEETGAQPARILRA